MSKFDGASLLAHAKNSRQRQIVKAYNKAGNFTKAGRMLGMHPVNVQRTLSKLAGLAEVEAPATPDDRSRQCALGRPGISAGQYQRCAAVRLADRSDST